MMYTDPMIVFLTAPVFSIDAFGKTFALNNNSSNPPIQHGRYSCGVIGA